MSQRALLLSHCTVCVYKCVCLFSVGALTARRALACSQRRRLQWVTFRGTLSFNCARAPDTHTHTHWETGTHTHAYGHCRVLIDSFMSKSNVTVFRATNRWAPQWGIRLIESDHTHKVSKQSRSAPTVPRRLAINRLLALWATNTPSGVYAEIWVQSTLV